MYGHHTKPTCFPREIPLLLWYFWAEFVLLSQPAHGAEAARGLGAGECTLTMLCSSWGCFRGVQQECVNPRLEYSAALAENLPL